ncbi:DegT/DnrJ/EryC1/StrS family aminotransferase [Streptomyces sp. NPDC058257]|uniref:DegT/DnrJ/EryC1/StrS family aminotransferase n=1 Tax=Streptomyces sp. NPDC058257 TaxID=3346409 RepID=UPI0036E9D257
MPLVPAVEIEVPDAERREVLAEVDRLLRAGRFSQGVNVEAFEEEFAAFTRTPSAVAVASGTTALELIFRALGVQGREVVVPAGTNFATYIAAERAGATVRLTDVDPATMAPTLEQVRAACTPRTAAVAVVHTGGLIGPDTEAIATWCEQRGVALVEDCAHAHGSERAGRHAGTFGVAGAFSFFATKVMTTGEGGMVVTGDDQLAQEIKLLRNLGKPEAWVSTHTRPGWNARLPELAAVLGRAQLRRLPQVLAARRAVADGYADALRGLPVGDFLLPDHPYSGYKAMLMLPPDTDRDALKDRLREHSVQAAGEVYATPLHHQPVLADRHAGLRLPGTERACAGQLCLPIYPGLDEKRQTHVVSALCDSLTELAEVSAR